MVVALRENLGRDTGARAIQDHNLYTFDMRRMERARCVHKDHVSAVLDIDFSPTGRSVKCARTSRTCKNSNVRMTRFSELHIHT
jgi:WD repeat and SOF domain-containing protein 1